MSLIAYPIILIAFIVLIWIFGKEKQDNATHGDIPEESKYKWSIVIKSKGKLYKDIEDDDPSKVGYYIYQNFATKLDQVDVYVKDNQNNEILKIQKTYESECMIGVDHPDKGHIGYLPFEKVEKI